MTSKTVDASTMELGQVGTFDDPLERSLLVVCPSCSSDATPGARFCHLCGVSLKIGEERGFWNARTLTVMAAAGAALAIVGIALVTFIDLDQSNPSSSPSASFVSSTPATGQPPDLSTMTPREAADRLFNRIMMATEQGNPDEASQFIPMALQAYDLLGSLDQDALYHVGRIHETAGNIEETEAVITELRATAPEHLLATLLEHDIAVRRGDEAAVEQAAARFLAAYDAEIAGNAQEYIDHRSSLEKLRGEAQAKLTTPN